MTSRLIKKSLKKSITKSIKKQTISFIPVIDALQYLRKKEFPYG